VAALQSARVLLTQLPRASPTTTPPHNPTTTQFPAICHAFATEMTTTTPMLHHAHLATSCCPRRPSFNRRYGAKCTAIPVSKIFIIAVFFHTHDARPARNSSAFAASRLRRRPPARVAPLPQASPPARVVFVADNAVVRLVTLLFCLTRDTAAGNSTFLILVQRFKRCGSFW